jgi:hypothetical protein
MQTNPTTERHRAASKSPDVGKIRPGDQVRLYDAFFSAYHWHVVTETIIGARPMIKVDAYSTFISASLVSGHRKGGRRNG